MGWMLSRRRFAPGRFEGTSTARGILASAVPILILLIASCRTTRPRGEETPIAPLTATGPAVEQALAERLHSFPGERTLMRMRASAGERTQSFRAQLEIDSAGRTLLTAYTPLGTTAMRVYAGAGEVTFVNDLQETWWRGPAADFSRSFGFFGAMNPATMALLLVGLPPAGGGLRYEFGEGGLQRASFQDVAVTFDPPAYPPHRVTVVRGAQRLEIEHLDSAYSNASVDPPEIPKEYRCCVPPAI